jgi:hypothetical protein
MINRKELQAARPQSASFDLGPGNRQAGRCREDEELKKHLEGMESRIKAELTEVMRNMQSELLRGFAAHSGGITLRVRKVEADQSNLDAALSGRVEILEKRLGEIEQRLGGA